MKKLSHLFALTGALAFIASTVPYTSASAAGGGYGGSVNSFDGHEMVTPFEPGFTAPVIGQRSTTLSGIAKGPASAAATALIVRAIEGAYTFCASAEQQEYLVSCLSDRFAEIAAEIPKSGDYAEAAKILKNASAKMQAIARDNKSKTLPKARLKGVMDGAEITTSRLIPVETSAVNASVMQTAEVLEETQTLLLRSAENSDRRKIPYEQIAQAVGSQKVLLRSL